MKGTIKAYFRFLNFSRFNLKRGLTLIELMLAVSILAVGIAFIMRSFLTMIAAQETAINHVRAGEFLEQKLDELELQAQQEGGVEPGVQEGAAMLGSRPAQWKLEIIRLEEEELETEDEKQRLGDEEEEKEKITICEAQARLSWPETGKTKEMVLVTYFLEKQEEE